MIVEDITVYFDNDKETTAVKCYIDGNWHLSCDIRENYANKTLFTAVFSNITLLSNEPIKHHNITLDELCVCKMYEKHTDFSAEYLENRFSMIFIEFDKILTIS